MGLCTYTLVKHRDFEILAEKSECSFPHTGAERAKYFRNRHPSSCLNTIIVKINGHILKMKQRQEVQFNGDEITTISVMLENGITLNTISSIWMTGIVPR